MRTRQDVETERREDFAAALDSELAYYMGLGPWAPATEVDWDSASGPVRPPLTGRLPAEQAH